jgi:hypothetical protein
MGGVARAKTRSTGATGMIASRSSLIEVEHENVGGFADFQRAGSRRAIGEAAVGDDRSEKGRALDDAVEAPAAVQEMAEPHFAQSVVVLVERRGVDAERDAAAAFDRLADRRDAGAQMQVRTRDWWR